MKPHPTASIALAIVAALLLTACAEDSESRRLVNPGTVIRVQSPAAAPSVAQSGTTVLFSVHVDADNAIQEVLINLSSLAGPSAAPMFDDGTNGDVTADDGIYSLAYLLPSPLVPGQRFVPFTVRDEKDFTYNGSFTFTVNSLAPVFDVASSSITNADGISGPVFGPNDTLELRIAVTDPDGDDDQLTVTANLSGAFAGAADETLTWNASTSLYELDYFGPRDMSPTGGLGVIVVTATDPHGTSTQQQFIADAENWVGIAGSADGHGLSSTLGWSIGSFVTTDPAGNIYVAYSNRVSVPTSIQSSGWFYAAYVKRYNVTTGVWEGLDGSDTGLGLCLNTQGRVIRSGWIRDIQYYAETNQGAGNKEAIYVVFDGHPDYDYNGWDTFMMRWNITDGQWEALGTGADASDWITDSFDPTAQDAGGLSRHAGTPGTPNSARAQEGRVTFDPATDDVYVTYHAQINTSGSSRYAVYVKRFNRTTGAWEDFNGATPADGITDDHDDNWKFPQIVHHAGKLYVAYVNGATSGDMLMREADLATGTWSAATTIYDASTENARFPKLAVDSTGRLYLSVNTQTSDNGVSVFASTTATWNNPANWVPVDGTDAFISIDSNASSQAIHAHLALDSNDNLYVVWNQRHAGMSDDKRGVFARMWDGIQWREVRGSWSDDGLSNYGSEDHWLPHITVGPDDRPVVCYDTFWGGGSGNDRRKIYVKALR